MAKVRYISHNLYVYSGTTENSSTWNHVITGDDSALLVMVHGGKAGGTATYAGVAMTREVDDSGNWTIFTLVNPTAGTNAVSITWPIGTESYLVAVSISSAGASAFSGVGVIGAGGLAASVSLDVATPNERSMVVDFVVASGEIHPTGGQTELDVSAGAQGCSYKQAPQFGGTVAMSWAADLGTNTWAIAAISFDAPAEGVPAGMTPVMMR